jgi:M6 family metalloprotease-like protein
VNPYIGDRRQLVILVAFADRSFKDDETTTMELWDKIFNTKNLTEAPYKGSVHDYFFAQSYSQLNLTFDLQYVQLSENCEKYRSWDMRYDDPADNDDNSQYLVQDIMEVLKTRDIDWSLYDWDGDGYVNQLLIVYAGEGMNDGGGKNSIWPHQWWLSEHLKDHQPDVYCDPVKVNCGDKDYLVDSYCAIEEIGGSYASFGTICHEYSHCFGFPDFYNSGTRYVGAWDLMDDGNYNGGGYCPPGYSAHERMLMGWLDITELSEPTVINDLGSLEEQSQAYLIRNDGYANEYYIVENRQQTGWDQYLPGSGIVIFHIDYDEDVWENGLPNKPSHKRYTIIHANNITSYSRKDAVEWTYPYGENDSLTNLSKPAASLLHENIDGTKFMNKPIWNMEVTGGVASFTFIEEPTGIWERKTEGKAEILFDLGPIYIIRNARGEIKKVIKH